MRLATIMPVGKGREENVTAVCESLLHQTQKPEVVVFVRDGEDARIAVPEGFGEAQPYVTCAIPKHKPGQEQPRNIGVRLVEQLNTEHDYGINHVHFLDSDVILHPDAILAYHQALAANPTHRVLIGPYDWLPPGVRHPVASLRNDVRWARFDEAPSWRIYEKDLSAGLACFSGNLCWPIASFLRVGGFWNELTAGRVEDGELGLRAVGMGIPISFVRDARGWHLDHERNYGWIAEVNAREVPMLNARHPWKELGEGGQELFVVDEDGKRFNWRCPICHEEMNSATIWEHQRGCPK